MSEAISRVGELALVICLIYGLALLPSFALSGYPYSRPIVVNTSVSVAEYTLPINLTYDSDIPANFSGLRFTDTSDNLLPFTLVEKVDSNYAVFDVNCTLSNANGTQLYVHYGNSEVTDGASANVLVYPAYWSPGQSVNYFGFKFSNGSTIAESGGGLNFSDATANDQWNTLAFNNSMTLETGVGLQIIATARTLTSMTYDRLYGPHIWTNATYYVGTIEFENLGSFYINSGYAASQTDASIAGVAGNTYEYTTTVYGTQMNTSRNGTLTNNITMTSTFGKTFYPGLALYETNGGGATYYTVFEYKAKKYMTVAPTYEVGDETLTSSVLLLNTPVANIVSASLNISSAETITDVYWDFGDSSTGYSNTTTTTHNFTTSGYFLVTATVTASATNYTATSANITVYAPLTKVVITPSSYVPFLSASSTVNLTATLTGGTSYTSFNWTLTYPNATTGTAISNNQTYYEVTATTGIYQISAYVCDVPSSTCFTNTTSFNAWNITGGKNLHSPFNGTTNCIANVYENDCLDLTSTTSLTWNYNNSVKTGTTAQYCFNSSNAFWNNSQYAHHRVYANITWNSETYQTNFTVVTAKYNTSQDGVCGGSSAYKLLVGKVYNEDTFAEIAANHTYIGLLALTTGYGHEQDVGSIYTGQTLNTTLCLNATPLVPFYLDGIITYSSSGYVTRTYAWDNASMTLYATESAANGNLYYFYTTANTTTTATIDITVIQAGDYVDGAIVKAMAYNNNTLTWVTVQSAITNDVGAVTFELENCPTFYKFVVDLDGTTIYSGEVECISGTSYTITILSDELEEYEVFEGVTTTCTYSNITNYLICTVSDGTGKVLSSNLVVNGWGTTTEYCDTSEESSSTTLICDTSTYDTGLYSYFLKVTTSGYTYSVDSGTFEIYEAPVEFYDSNFVFGFLAVGILAMIPMSGVLKVIAITFVMFVMNVVGLISIPGAVLPYLIGIGLIIIYELAKGGK